MYLNYNIVVKGFVRQVYNMSKITQVWSRKVKDFRHKVLLVRKLSCPRGRIFGSGTSDDYCSFTQKSFLSIKRMRFNKLTKTKEPESTEHAYNYAIFLLGLSMRTEQEMRRKMTLRGYTPEVVDQTIAKLYEEKLLDDRHYAEVYINSLKEYRTFGFYGIKKKLLEKRLPKNDIEELLEQELPLEEELKIAQKLLAKELGSDYKKSQFSQGQKQKLARKLQAKGFRVDVIAKLVL
jgi:SOS response regulatory protein OraA/RecX